jgi:quercetin dioxygenase-like cupin family protein
MMRQPDQIALPTKGDDMSTDEHEPGHTSGTDERAPRDLHAPVQVIHLGELTAQVAAERKRRNADHTAYTLRNGADLRQVLLSFGPEGQLPDHHADGGVAIHVLAGEVTVEVEGTTYVLGPSDLLDIAPGLPHHLLARRASTVLLTIAPVGTVAHPDTPAP